MCAVSQTGIWRDREITVGAKNRLRVYVHLSAAHNGSHCGSANQIPGKSRQDPGINPEEIPKAAKDDPEQFRDQVGILACKSFRFRDQ